MSKIIIHGSADRFEAHKEQLGIYEKVLHQKRSDSNKIYSLHEPDVRCYTKGKELKKYEFDTKASILVTQTSSVIISALIFNATFHDSNALLQVIAQYERINNKKPKKIYVEEVTKVGRKLMK